MAKTIAHGSKVKVHYTGTLDSGEKFDSSEGREPLSFEVGAGNVIPGFEKGLIGLKAGDEKDVHILAKEAYGGRHEHLLQKIPLKDLPDHIKSAKKGMVLRMQAPDGQLMQAVIADIDENEMTLDLNHPLAGKNLNFKLKVVDVE